MDRLEQVKDSLEQLFADPEWKKWAAQEKYAAAAEAAKTLVHDHRFWKAADDLNSISRCSLTPTPVHLSLCMDALPSLPMATLMISVPFCMPILFVWRLCDVNKYDALPALPIASLIVSVVFLQAYSILLAAL